MKKEAFRDEIKLRLTGNILELEIDDATIDKLIDAALREVQRYICSTRFITVPFKKCIDFNKKEDTGGREIKVSSVSRVYRAVGFVSDSGSNDTNPVDPMYASQWQLLSGIGNLQGFQDYAYNYMSWNTLLQMRNTTSTDLAHIYDKASNMLYINIASQKPQDITIEYVPRYDDVSEIESDYWIDITIRLAIALAKVTVGRIRSRYTQANALWSQDGQQLLDEGNTELSELRQLMLSNSQIVYPID